MAKVSKKERAQAIEDLRALVNPGMTVYCVIRHVSRSGMYRVIDPMVVDPEGGMRNIGYLAAKALEWGYDDNHGGGVKVTGCGMDMVFHLVYVLGSVLFPDGVPSESLPERMRHAQYDPEQGKRVTPAMVSGGYALNYGKL